MPVVWEHPALTAYRDWLVSLGVEGDSALLEGFLAGYEAALESVRPLLEAARAYRDADGDNETEYYARLLVLTEAARTFEAGHEGETD